MDLGDGLKLEMEVLDGKPRLILASSDTSRPATKMGIKTRAPKQPLRTRHTGHVLKSTQNACIKQENLNPRSQSSLSMTKGEKLQVIKHSSHETATKDHSLIFQSDGTNRYPDFKNPNGFKKSEQKPQIACVSAEDLRSLLGLTQEQLQKLLMTVKEETRCISETHNEKQAEVVANETSEENTVLLQKACEVSSVPDEADSNSSRKQEANLQPGQKVIKGSWKPANMFSTLGEREEQKALLEFRKTQWKKELDEQVALKKKLKETLEGEVGCFWETPSNNKAHQAKIETADQNKEAVPQEQPFSALKHEQQKKWLEELDKQKEEAKLRKTEEKLELSQAEEHDRWAMHFDSFKNHLNANAQHTLNGIYKKQPESLCLSPDPQELTAFIHPFSPAALGNLMPSKVGNPEKAAKTSTLEQSQKVSFLRSMTALLDPAQIEERNRRQQKQLEHQKAIMAQVEENRKKKQLEEEQRKQEEQKEEERLAREKEQMQKQFEEDMLKQKQKKEFLALKTNELYQTMQKAQEFARRLKQEQRIQDLAQKGHDVSNLQKNLGGADPDFENCNTDISHQSHNSSDDIKSHIDQQTSPRKDAAVQTDYINTSVYTETAEEKTVGCGSPGISIQCKETSNSKKKQKEMQNIDKNINSGKETGGIYGDLHEQYARRERQIKPLEKDSKRPHWNINNPGKRYIPASERYPKQLQKQRRQNKLRRQMELLQLVERNTSGNVCPKKGGYSDRSPSPYKKINVKNKGHRVSKEETLHKNHLNQERTELPPVPAVKNSLHQVQQKQTHTSNFLVHNSKSRKEKSIKTDTEQRSFLPAVTETGRPHSPEFIPYIRTNEVYYLDPDAPGASPSTHDPQYQQLHGTEQRSFLPAVTEAGRPPSPQFIPYVRTNEVYYLDPDAPGASPSTHDPQYQHFNDSYQTPRQLCSFNHAADPLLNPDDKNRERQQAILKGLSELRQGTAVIGAINSLFSSLKSSQWNKPKSIHPAKRITHLRERRA